MTHIKYLKTVISFLLLCLLTSCDKEGDLPNEISIMGTWVRYQSTFPDGEVRNHFGSCPDILTMKTTTFTVEDFMELEDPCENSDLTNGFYELDGKSLMIWYSPDEPRENFTILELSEKVLKVSIVDEEGTTTNEFRRE